MKGNVFMKENKNIIIILSILMMTIIGIIIAIFIIKTNQENSNIDMEKPIEEVETPFEEPQKISRLEYNTVNTAVNRYIQIINKNNSAYAGIQDANTKMNERIISLLSDSYIEKNKITTENLQKYVSLENEQLLFVPLKIKMLTSDGVRTYKIEGLAENVKYESKGKKSFIVNIDYTNQTFSIEPTQSKYEEINQANKITSIKQKEDNMYTNKTVNDQTRVKDYITIYKRLVLADPQTAYEYMDEEYRNKRFGNIDTFKEYINSNKETIEKITLEQYLVENHDDYTEYIGKDKYGNLYIFDEKNILDYTIKLDTYTIPTDKFKETYNEAEDYKKVQMNIDKFFQMINRQDYKTAYSCLAQSYKNNYFKTEEEFTKFAKSNFYTYNKVSYQNYEQKGDKLYTFDIKLSDITGEKTDKKEIKIIMQLNEDLNFEMSFGM